MAAPEPNTTLARDGHTLSRDYNVDGWLAYINDGGYTDDEQSALVDLLMREQEAEFDRRLPEGCHWFPHTSEVIGPVSAKGDDFDAQALMLEAVQAVVDRYDDIETQALGAR